MTLEVRKPTKIVFAPGTLEMMESESTPEELQAYLDKVKQLFDSGELEAMSEPLDMDDLETSDPELFHALMSRVESLATTIRPTLQ